MSLADYRALLQNQEVRSTRGHTLGTPEITDDLPTCVGDLQQLPNVASYDVNTGDASGADLSDKLGAENERTDVLPLDKFSAYNQCKSQEN